MNIVITPDGLRSLSHQVMKAEKVIHGDVYFQETMKFLQTGAKGCPVHFTKSREAVDAR